MRRRPTLALAAALLLLAGSAHAFLNDADIHLPPDSGPYAYDAFTADSAGFPARGETFVDPVFGETIRRITDDRAGCGDSQLYARNGFLNADGTLLLHKRCDGTVMVDTTTGEHRVTGVPGAMYTGSFDPVDPDLYYELQGSRLMQLVPSTGALTLVKDFGTDLGLLGGSVDFIDATGRYFLVELGGDLRVWDRVDDVLYDGTITFDYGEGWAGISPDAAFVILRANDSTARSYAIDHAARRVDTAGTIFWNLCGDHSDVLSASDGRTYLVGFECYDEAAVYRIDVTRDLAGASPADQRAANRRLFDTDWPDSGHFSCVSRGALRDWCFVALEDGTDRVGAAGAWRPYRQEIVMANVLTGEVRRLAHHRSRNLGDNYFYTPRVSTSFDGSIVVWASNFGVLDGAYVDIYGIRVAGAGPIPGADAGPTPGPDGGSAGDGGGVLPGTDGGPALDSATPPGRDAGATPPTTTAEGGCSCATPGLAPTRPARPGAALALLALALLATERLSRRAGRATRRP